MLFEQLMFKHNISVFKIDYCNYKNIIKLIIIINSKVKQIPKVWLYT